VFGLGGGLLIICALVLASQTFVVPRNDYQLEQLRDSMLVLAGAGVGILVVAALTRRYLPHAPVLGKVLLAPPQGEELSELSRREALTMLEHLVGAEGKAVTPLVPGGKARFGDELVDVVTDGDFIDRGQRLQVVEVLGNHVVVRSLDT
jgi:membrane-bound ClpP family serine protease